MPGEAHKSVVRRFFKEALENGQIEVLEEILDPRCTYIDGGELRFTGRDEFIEYVIEARAAYTETGVVIGDLVAEGDKVAVRCEYHLATGGDRSRYAVMGFFEFHEGRIIAIRRNIVAVAGHH